MNPANMPQEPPAGYAESPGRDDLAARFARDGFVGPISLGLPRALLDRVVTRLDAMLTQHQVHPLYGRFSVRDWHLLDDELLTILTHPHIVDSLKPLLGPDLLLWRSKVFVKRPGESPLGWHQEWGAFNGEEIGNDRPGLEPSAAAQASAAPWNLTVWVAFDDIDASLGPIRFAAGSQVRRFPIDMQPIVDSEFWHDPFLDTASARDIVERARANAIVLDIRTDHIFSDTDADVLSIDEAKARLMVGLSGQVGAVTLDFDTARFPIIEMPMPAGSCVIFSERTMHGSGPNTSSRRRLAVNARYTRADTLVYPMRLRGETIDGSNLDIRAHRCVLVAGRPLHPDNLLIPQRD